jgi:U3 small nucleolar RNA-associated protein 14
LRTRIENRILVRDPVRDLTQPFGIEDIDTAAEAILQRDRFDRVLADTDSESEESSGDESSSESDSESSDSESEDEREERRRRAKKREEDEQEKKCVI